MTQPPILVCYDRSAEAGRVIETAGALFPGRPAIVLSVTPHVATERIRTTSVEQVREELLEDVRAGARREAAALAAEGMAVAREAGLEPRSVSVENGGGANTIARVASEEGAAVVAVARRIAKGVLSRCEAPVLVV